VHFPAHLFLIISRDGNEDILLRHKQQMMALDVQLQCLQGPWVQLVCCTNNAI
jgi:hypothetical protein